MENPHIIILSCKFPCRAMAMMMKAAAEVNIMVVVSVQVEMVVANVEIEMMVVVGATAEPMLPDAFKRAQTPPKLRRPPTLKNGPGKPPGHCQTLFGVPKCFETLPARTKCLPDASRLSQRRQEAPQTLPSACVGTNCGTPPAPLTNRPPFAPHASSNKMTGARRYKKY